MKRTEVRGNDHEEWSMSETKASDYGAMVHKEIAELDGKRGLGRRSGGLFRKAAQRHRNGCLAGPGGGVIPNG